MTLSTPGMTIAEAASSLGVSSRTVRRFIKSGKLAAELVPGPFGDEYRIFKLPADFGKRKPIDKTPVQTSSQTSVQTIVHPPDQFVDIIRDLQEKNINLAGQLGAAMERIRALENQVKLLSTYRQPWWKRLFRRRDGTG